MVASLYAGLLFAMSQALHARIFLRVGAHHLMGFPSLEISPARALGFALPLGLAAFVLTRVSALPRRRSDLPWVIASCFSVVLLSQVLGRSLIKFVFEFSGCLVLVGDSVLRRHFSFGSRITESVADVAHRELWDLLKLSVTIGLFYAGTLGLGFAVQFLRELYFSGDELMTQFQMHRYGVMFLAVFIGFTGFVVRRIVVELAAVRTVLKLSPTED